MGLHLLLHEGGEVMLNWKRVLKPVFEMAAKPGLFMPHSYNLETEDELMIAGAKPVGIVGADEITAKMQEAINQGHIVHIGDHLAEFHSRIYCHPDEIEGARRVAKFFSCEGQDISPEEIDFMFCFVGAPVGRDVKIEEAMHLNMRDNPDGIGNRAYDGQATPSMEALLAGSIKAIEPLRYGHGLPVNDDLERAVESDSLAAVDFKIESLIQVYAQADKVEEGKELYARYYKDSKGYRRLDNVDECKRIGELLGYRENDTAIFVGEKYTNPLIRKVMDWTADARRWCRKEVMLMEAEDAKRGSAPIPPGM
jgi:hypothetical protein